MGGAIKGKNPFNVTLLYLLTRSQILSLLTNFKNTEVSWLFFLWILGAYDFEVSLAGEWLDIELMRFFCFEQLVKSGGPWSLKATADLQGFCNMRSLGWRFVVDLG